MLKWLPYPMVRIAGFFGIGVLLGIYFPDLVGIGTVSFLIGILALGYFALTLSAKENKFPLFSGVVGLAIVFLLGYARLILSTDSNHEDHLSKIKEKIEAYEAIVKSVPEPKAKSWKIEIELSAVKTGRWQQATGRLLLYVSKEKFSPNDWHYGDHILVRGSPQEVRPPANPGEFDFKRFLSFKNISHQQFVKSEATQVITPASQKGLFYYSHRAREWSMEKLNHFISGEQERAIVSALVLGVTDGIDNDLQRAYAASGAMHVLAVSGMHVGIIYGIILFLLKPVSRYRWSKWGVAIVSLICLWSFAFVTGLSASVLRAVTMFSFLALSRPFGLRTNIYNTLASSVFVLLVFNPYLIMSVGFQLSYLAVLGIVYLQRPLYNLLDIENRLGSWVWQITCVSMAAQIATFGLGLLYFHQFPTYFLISNLFVIPLATLVLVVGIFLLSVSFISPLASMVGIALEGLVQVLNWIVFQTETLPFSLLNDIHLTTPQCLLLMAILLSLILLFEHRSIKWLYVAFSLTFLFAAFRWHHFFSFIDQRKFIVYSVNGHHAIEYTDRGTSYFLADAALQQDDQRIRFHVQPNRLAHGVLPGNAPIPFKQDTLGVTYFRFNGMTMGWIKKEETTFPTNGSFDYLLVSNNGLSKTALRSLTVNTIIFDGSNTYSYVRARLREAEQNGIKTYATMDKGAFIF